MRPAWFGLSLFLAVASLAAAPRARAQSRDEREIRFLLDRQVNAANSVDPHVVLPTLADYAQTGGPFYLLFASSVTPGAGMEAQVHSELARLTARTFALTTPLTLHVQKNIAWAAFTWHANFTYKDGTRSSLDGRTTEAFIREGKRWKIAHEHDSLVAPIPLTASVRDAEGRQVVALERKAWASIENKQLTALDGYFADDFSMFEDNQAYRVRGKAEELQGLATWLRGTTVQNYQMLDPQVDVLGSTAMLTYYFTESGVSAGKHFSDSGKVSAVFVKRNGAWRALHVHRSLNR